jgi:o-succinylbenzoate---CoA ligase
MSERIRVLLTDADPQVVVSQLEQGWEAGQTLAVVVPQERSVLQAALPAHWSSGPAVVLGTGGSSGARRWCIQPLSHLQRGARATARWLQVNGLDPARAEIFNPLPLHHVSGLMPWVRARCWGAALRWLPPAWLRDPGMLLVQCRPKSERQALISLVPTQLYRLMDHRDGLTWLQHFSLIWVGGAALAPEMAQRARDAGLRLSPCYGSTETGAMVAALSPERFLVGHTGCGHPLPHAALRLDPESSALQILSSSLALGFLSDGAFAPLPLKDGWWTSGDAASLGPEGLTLLGRLDGAINSGGETVFPEQVRQRILQLSAAARLPLRELLVLSEPDSLWGERLVALVRLDASNPADLLNRLEVEASGLPPSQRPRRWVSCPELERDGLGKWEMARWRRELAEDEK